MEKKSHKSSTLSAKSHSGVGGAATSKHSVYDVNSSHTHQQSHQHHHHHHQSSHLQQQHNSNNNINPVPLSSNISFRQQRMSASNHSHHNNINNKNNNNNNNNNNNITNNNNNNSILELKPFATVDQTAKSRNKNEEAITDLRQRIPDIENIFDVHSRIGNGTFSTVLLGTLKKDRELPDNVRRKFAIKHHIPTSHPDRIIKELKCMVDIGGTDNVVGINCTIRHNESVAFIMPYMPHDRFHDFFSKMDLSEVQCYMRNLLIALRRVHKFNVIHRDVKPSNFLYNRRKRQFLLVDFGLAQQVPQQQIATMAAIAAAANNNDNNNTSNYMDGKRAREVGGDANNGLTSDTCSTTGDVSGSAKRLRCTGPQGDQQVAVDVESQSAAAAAAAAATTGPNARITNSCIVGASGSPFKMPLKQLNEISTPSKTTANASGTSVASGANGAYNSPMSRQVKSSALLGGAAMTNRLQQKLRTQQNTSGTTAGASSNATLSGINNDTPSSVNTTNKYNTNRNLSNSTASKCFCYGNPQVCNICLIKKEIHASRAGTPGYRPPEVLLKYPDQTTAVDIWASGVIFLSILSSVYPFFKAPNDYVALAEMVTIFGDKTIRKTAFVLDRLVTLSQKTKPLDLRKLCVRFRNRSKFSSPELLKKYQRGDGSCEVCKNCDQFYFNCLCAETHYNTEPLGGDDPFPPSAYDLLYRLLEVNPHKRITADEALKHPFFSEAAAVAAVGVVAAKKHARE